MTKILQLSCQKNKDRSIILEHIPKHCFYSQDCLFFSFKLARKKRQHVEYALKEICFLTIGRDSINPLWRVANAYLNEEPSWLLLYSLCPYYRTIFQRINNLFVHFVDTLTYHFFIWSYKLDLAFVLCCQMVSLY